MRFVEVEELRNWKYYKDIERIRTSDWWIPATPWLANVPQGIQLYSYLHLWIILLSESVDLFNNKQAIATSTILL